jgi:predicted glutamine amidotransferase
MCELFALSSDTPANVTFSLGAFGERGGRLGRHRDGWGIAFREGRDFRLIKEAAPAASSACLRFIQSNEIRSDIVMSHLRLASVPRETFDSATLRVALLPAQDGARHLSLIATQPVSADKSWTELPPGEVVVFQRGQRLSLT